MRRRCLAAAAARRYVTEWEDWRTKARKEAVVEAETNERTKAASKLSEMCKALKVEEFFWGDPKGQLNSEWIYEVIVSPKIPTKNCRDFCPKSLLQGLAEISVIFGWDFGTKDDLVNSFWI